MNQAFFEVLHYPTFVRNLFGGDFVKDMLYAILALVTAIATAFTFYRYVSGPGETLYIALAIIFAVLTVVLGGLFLSGKVNKNSDIHITE